MKPSEPSAPSRPGLRVVRVPGGSIRSTLVGDKMDAGDDEGTLNEWAAQGWHVKSIVEASVSGRVGPGGTAGLIVVFERRLTQGRRFFPPGARGPVPSRVVLVLVLETHADGPVLTSVDERALTALDKLVRRGAAASDEDQFNDPRSATWRATGLVYPPP